MRLLTSSSAVPPLEQWAAAIRSAGGFIAPDFTVIENAGHLRVASDTGHADGDVVLTYDPAVAVPLAGLAWPDNPRDLVPIAGVSSLSGVQRNVLDAWITLMTNLDRVAHLEVSHPAIGLPDGELRQLLASAGYPGVATRGNPDRARRTLLASHSEPDGAGGLRLVPLKNLVDHHPQGASQDPVPGRVAVAATTQSGPEGTFEDYGDLDALDQVLGFGYLDDAADVVHATPCEVEVDGWLVTVARPLRRQRTTERIDLSLVAQVEPGRLTLSRMSLRERNRPRIVSLVAMALAARGVERTRCSAMAERVVDAVLGATSDYFSHVSARATDLVTTAETQPSADLVLRMADVQRSRLNRWA